MGQAPRLAIASPFICPFEFMTQKPVGSPWSGCLYPPGAHPDSHPRAAKSEPVRGSLDKRPSRGPTLRAAEESAS